MSRLPTISDQRLGMVLQQAGLVSAQQVEVALEEQHHAGRRIGEILASHGWLKQESADFFAEVWPWIQDQTWQEPLGQYLKQAALLDEAQIQAILREQRQTPLKFGTLVILKGWVRRQTVNFFLEHLDPKQIQAIRQRERGRKGALAAEAIRRKLLENKVVNPFLLLLTYQKVLELGAITADDSREQNELLRLGLVRTDHQILRLATDLDPLLLNPQWVVQELNQRRPYSHIRLKLLELSKKSEHPYQVLSAIQAWTGNQADLTQILYQVTVEASVFIEAGEEATQVEKLVDDHILQNWESGAAAEHLRGLRDRWLNHQRCRPQYLLDLYGRILEEFDIPAEDSLEEQVLLTLGLVTRHNQTLSIANLIYRHVFNHHWITQAIIDVLESQAEGLESQALETSEPPNISDDESGTISETQPSYDTDDDSPIPVVKEEAEDPSVPNVISEDEEEDEDSSSLSSPIELEDADVLTTNSESEQFLLKIMDISKELSEDDITSFFASPAELEDADILTTDSESEQFLLRIIDISKELSEDDITSFMSPRLDISKASSKGSPFVGIPEASAALPAQDSFSLSTPAKPKPRRQALWLTLGTLMLGGAITIAVFWRPSSEMTPVTSAPSTLSEGSSGTPQSGENLTPAGNGNSNTAVRADQALTIATPSSTQSMATHASTSSSTVVISALDPTVKVPIVTTGSTQKQLLNTLGLPTWERKGYYPGSRAFFYKGIVPDRIDLGYLVHKTTGKLLQTEIAFAQSVPLETIQTTLRQLLQGTLPPSVQERLTQIYQRRINQHTFAVKAWKGEIHRNQKGWIYIGIWDTGFH
ncbi:hypothetical protein [Acaryochloris sp. IP29b_bin.148]|uniref:hypothetical protein n=1 Tax=Acaryochloris sp. IP29b_bin.148 TaxID=2969218 RepID=UPI0026022789|nr:hypothetical protein [Acaryochloris sp. IP29b_bin.148]